MSSAPAAMDGVVPMATGETKDEVKVTKPKPKPKPPKQPSAVDKSTARVGEKGSLPQSKESKETKENEEVKASSSSSSSSPTDVESFLQLTKPWSLLLAQAIKTPQDLVCFCSSSWKQVPTQIKWQVFVSAWPSLRPDLAVRLCLALQFPIEVCGMDWLSYFAQLLDIGKRSESADEAKARNRRWAALPFFLYELVDTKEGRAWIGDRRPMYGTLAHLLKEYIETSKPKLSIYQTSLGHKPDEFAPNLGTHAMTLVTNMDTHKVIHGPLLKTAEDWNIVKRHSKHAKQLTVGLLASLPTDRFAECWTEEMKNPTIAGPLRNAKRLVTTETSISFNTSSVDDIKDNTSDLRLAFPYLPALHPVHKVLTSQEILSSSPFLKLPHVEEWFALLHKSAPLMRNHWLWTQMYNPELNQGVNPVFAYLSMFTPPMFHVMLQTLLMGSTVAGACACDGIHHVDAVAERKGSGVRAGGLNLLYQIQCQRDRVTGAKKPKYKSLQQFVHKRYGKTIHRHAFCEHMRECTPLFKDAEKPKTGAECDTWLRTYACVGRLYKSNVESYHFFAPMRPYHIESTYSLALLGRTVSIAHWLLLMYAKRVPRLMIAKWGPLLTSWHKDRSPPTDDELKVALGSLDQFPWAMKSDDPRGGTTYCDFFKLHHLRLMEHGPQHNEVTKALAEFYEKVRQFGAVQRREREDKIAIKKAASIYATTTAPAPSYRLFDLPGGNAVEAALEAEAGEAAGEAVGEAVGEAKEGQADEAEEGDVPVRYVPVQNVPVQNDQVQADFEFASRLANMQE